MNELIVNVIPASDGRVIYVQDSTGYKAQYFVGWDEVLLKSILMNITDAFVKRSCGLEKNTSLEIIIEIKKIKVV